MSGLDVVGGISSVIAIIDACVRIYGAAQKDLKLSETFHTTARRLPLRRLGKGNRVEEIMKSITEDVKHVVNNDGVRAIRPEQRQRLDQIMRELQSQDSTVPDDHGSFQKATTYGVTMNNQLADAPQFNYQNMSGTQNF
nr:hypothetical protein LTR18_011171 [Exophiala xenobiotica]